MEKLKEILGQALKLSNWVSALIGAVLGALASGCSIFGSGVGPTVA